MQTKLFLGGEIASECEHVQPVKQGKLFELCVNQVLLGIFAHSVVSESVIPIKRDTLSQAVFQPAPLSSGDPDALNFVDICFGN